MTSDSEETLDSIRESIQEYDSFSNWFRDTLIGGTVGAIAMAIVGFITGIGELLIAPFQAIGAGIQNFYQGTFASGIRVIDAGTQAAVESFMSGLIRWAGPFTYPIAVLVTILSIYILVQAFRYMAPGGWLRKTVESFRG